MSDSKKALVLHLAGVANPVLVALAESAAEDLPGKLEQWVRSGEVRAIPTEDGGSFVVNFGQVATAHVEDAAPHGHLYGKPSRRPAGLAAH
ncbi:hypothetical protein [Goodfellowiella coeruleoviolacea]|uniref:Uncharacterized protein n=1 Tax=Goodfellowiella coeruleoviolacea TaxID=334858 RepID=A0AAE3KEZ5_9PSEU|nr:hypothetical protein [Goodfellowiella coeruleoviolacea]MCP2164407.1 hypothetical protein [Goodfellowiella coeruleoviolacea]